jgi:hypothetical protein
MIPKTHAFETLAAMNACVLGMNSLLFFTNLKNSLTLVF